MALPVYRGTFGTAQAQRLLWRAGFGPRKGEAQALAARGLNGAVLSLTRPGKERFVGRPPRDENRRPLAPLDAFGHDHLWWLDRMVRTSRPLVERMTLIWHDWFATTNAEVGSNKFMLRQNKLFRTHALGSFHTLLLEVTKDPAMLLFLSGVYSTKDAPNENYGRELMELFTLGEGRGYTERDVRQQARALTGWTADYKDPIVFYKFRFEPSYHDKGTKTIFGRRGKFDWKDACRLCLENRAHGSFFVRKLWSYFIPTQIPATTERELIKLYRKQGYAIRPVVEAILRHPHLYTGPTMMKPPVVYTAGLMRALGRRITTSEWFIYALGTGQLLFYPPNVAGWKDDRWLDTATFRGRWNLTAFALHPGTLDPEKKAGTLPTDPGKVVSAALKSAGSPPLQKATLDLLLEFARRALEDAEDEYEQAVHPVLVYNAVRQLALVSPDYQAA
jgi:uncharacterized protein (DUF1800 family)